jgi:hypothetical protein
MSAAPLMFLACATLNRMLKAFARAFLSHHYIYYFTTSPWRYVELSAARSTSDVNTSAP